MAHQSRDPRDDSRFFTCSWCDAAIENRERLHESGSSPNYGICPICLDREISVLGTALSCDYLPIPGSAGGLERWLD